MLRITTYALLFLLVNGFTNTTQAQTTSCPEINLNHQDIGLEKIPLWDQEDTFLCYGYAAAVLVDSHLYKTGQSELKDPTSPFILAAQGIRYSQNLRTRSNFWGGLIDHSLLAAKEHGVCRDKHLLEGFGNQGPGQTIQRLRDFRQEARSLQQPRELKEQAQKLKDHLKNQLPHLHNMPTDAQLESWLQGREDSSLSQLLSSLCPTQKVELPSPQGRDRSYSTSGPSMAEKLNQLLMDRNPVALEFCAEVVTDRSFTPGWSGQCARHYAVVVGQKIKGDQCHVLVRDSQCESYNGAKNHCQQGHYWIEKSRILSNSYHMTWQ